MKQVSLLHPPMRGQRGQYHRIPLSFQPRRPHSLCWCRRSRKSLRVFASCFYFQKVIPEFRMEGERSFGSSKFFVQSYNSGTAAIPSSTRKASYRDGQGTIHLELNGRQLNWCPLSERLLLFSRVIGLPIVRVNGQRVTGPPHDYNGPTPPRGAEVFVGALPRDATEEELLPVFCRVGRIYQLRLMMDFSGTNRGYCFVQFFTIQEATNAIRVLKNYQLRPGRALGVFRSVENCRLQIDGIPFTLSPETVYEELVRVTDGVTKVTLFSMPISSRGPREFWTNSAIVEYESHWHAAMARRVLIPGGFTMNGFPVSVEWAKAEK